jgi:hypothetical protein
LPTAMILLVKGPSRLVAGHRPELEPLGLTPG